MSDFYCDEVLSGRTAVDIVAETANVLAFKHTRAHWADHVVVIPKRHVASLLDLGPEDDALMLELLGVIRQLAASFEQERGGAHIVTNLGKYQESKHLHFHIGAGDVISR